MLQAQLATSSLSTAARAKSRTEPPGSQRYDLTTAVTTAAAAA